MILSYCNGKMKPSCTKRRNKPALVALVDILSTVAADSRISIHRSTTTRALKSFRRGLRDNPTQIRREVSSISKSVMRTSVVTKREKKLVKSVPESSRRNQSTQSLSYRLLLAVGNQPAKEQKRYKERKETCIGDNLH